MQRLLQKRPVDSCTDGHTLAQCLMADYAMFMPNHKSMKFSQNEVLVILPFYHLTVDTEQVSHGRSAKREMC